MISENDLDKVLIVDVETTGLDPVAGGLLSIGAVWLLDPSEKFYLELSIDESIHLSERALEINGFTKEQCHDKSKPSEFEGSELFMEWVIKTSPVKPSSIIIGGQHPWFDRDFVRYRLKNGRSDNPKRHDYLMWNFSPSLLDLQSISFSRFHKKLSHKAICEALLIEPEPEPHNALSGAVSEMKCFRKLLGLDSINSIKDSVLGEE
jgi:DNA polymerase III epsilon subunit-like protein